MLRDLESLLLTIQDADGRNYMAEAVRCYSAGAFRAAVVLAMAAGMDDLRKKLDSLATSGGASQALRGANQNVQQLFAQQNCYERPAIAAANEHAAFLSAAQAKELNLLFDLRNLCAHPSGHAATAEEARHAITTMIDVVLVRPALFGVVAIDGIVQRMGSVNFFPTTDLEAIRTTVQHEVAHLHASLYPALIARMVKIAVDAAEAAIAQAAASNVGLARRSTLHLNAVHVLAGMTLLGGPTREAVWRARALTQLALQPEAYLDILLIIVYDGSGVVLVDQLTRLRVLQLIRGNLKSKTSNTARRAVRAVLAHLTDAEREDLYEGAVASILHDWTTDTPTAVREIDWDRLTRTFFETLIARAGSSTWAEANPAIDFVQSLSPEDAAQVPADLRAQYVLRVADVATGSYAARSAQPMPRGGLGARADFVDAFVEVCRSTPDVMRKRRSNWKVAVQILIASGRDDAVLALLEAFRGYDDWEVYTLCVTLSKSSEPKVAALATELKHEADTRDLPKNVPEEVGAADVPEEVGAS